MTNQNDFVIDNGTGLAVRTDIQDALQALAGNSSGNSEPSVKYAYQWWADSNAAVMKLRNSANDGWIELFQLDGTLTLEDGSASTPALSFRDDLNTGIFSAAADTFNVATGGVERMELGTSTIFNEDGEDVDFRIESDTNSHMFFVDAGNNRVGIGNSTPATALDLQGDLTITSTAPFISFVDSDNNDDFNIQVSGGLFSFNSTSDSATRMQIGSSGEVYFGTTNWPTGSLGKSAGRIMMGNEGSLTLWNETNSAGGGGTLKLACKEGSDATRVGFVNLVGGTENTSDRASFFKIQVANSSGSGIERFSIASGGDVTVTDGNIVVASGHGIDFSATGNSAGSMSSELLHDYEKGSWTPIFTDDGTSGNSASSYTRQLGWYCRTGDLVNIQLRLSNIVFSGFNTSHAAYIKNLPFPIQGDSGRLVTGTLMLSNVNLDSDTMSIGVLANVGGGTSNSFFRLFQSKDNDTWASITILSFTSGNNEIMVNFSYLTDG